MSDGLLDFIPDTTDGRLGRNVVWHDSRNRNFPARGALFAEDAPLATTIWSPALPPFDQGQESSCTAQAAVGIWYSTPHSPTADLTAYDEPTERFELYKEAQKHDPWEGEDYLGSSTDAPFKVMRQRDQIAEWRWCFGLGDILRTLTHHGPVAVGTYWYDGMFSPNPGGYIFPTGSVAGGHAYRLIGLDVDSRYVFGINSWGKDWGIDGWFRLYWDDLERLLGEEGEAVTIVLPVDPDVPPEPEICSCCGQVLPSDD